MVKIEKSKAKGELALLRSKVEMLLARTDDRLSSLPMEDLQAIESVLVKIVGEVQ